MKSSERGGDGQSSDGKKVNQKEGGNVEGGIKGGGGVGRVSERGGDKRGGEGGGGVARGFEDGRGRGRRGIGTMGRKPRPGLHSMMGGLRKDDTFVVTDWNNLTAETNPEEELRRRKARTLAKANARHVLQSINKHHTSNNSNNHHHQESNANKRAHRKHHQQLRFQQAIFPKEQFISTTSPAIQAGKPAKTDEGIRGERQQHLLQGFRPYIASKGGGKKVTNERGESIVFHWEEHPVLKPSLSNRIPAVPKGNRTIELRKRYSKKDATESPLLGSKSAPLHKERSDVSLHEHVDSSRGKTAKVTKLDIQDDEGTDLRLSRDGSFLLSQSPRRSKLAFVEMDPTPNSPPSILKRDMTYVEDRRSPDLGSSLNSTQLPDIMASPSVGLTSDRSSNSVESSQTVFGATAKLVGASPPRSTLIKAGDAKRDSLPTASSTTTTATTTTTRVSGSFHNDGTTELFTRSQDFSNPSSNVPYLGKTVHGVSDSQNLERKQKGEGTFGGKANNDLELTSAHTSPEKMDTELIQSPSDRPSVSTTQIGGWEIENGVTKQVGHANKMAAVPSSSSQQTVAPDNKRNIKVTFQETVRVEGDGKAARSMFEAAGGFVSKESSDKTTERGDGRVERGSERGEGRGGGGGGESVKEEKSPFLKLKDQAVSERREPALNHRANKRGAAPEGVSPSIPHPAEEDLRTMGNNGLGKEGMGEAGGGSNNGHASVISNSRGLCIGENSAHKLIDPAPSSSAPRAPVSSVSYANSGPDFTVDRNRNSSDFGKGGKGLQNEDKLERILNAAKNNHSNLSKDGKSLLTKEPSKFERIPNSGENVGRNDQNYIDSHSVHNSNSVQPTHEAVTKGCNQADEIGNGAMGPAIEFSDCATSDTDALRDPVSGKCDTTTRYGDSFKSLKSEHGHVETGPGAASLVSLANGRQPNGDSESSLPASNRKPAAGEMETSAAGKGSPMKDGKIDDSSKSKFANKAAGATRKAGPPPQPGTDKSGMAASLQNKQNGNPIEKKQGFDNPPNTKGKATSLHATGDGTFKKAVESKTANVPGTKETKKTGGEKCNDKATGGLQNGNKALLKSNGKLNAKEIKENNVNTNHVVSDIDTKTKVKVENQSQNAVDNKTEIGQVSKNGISRVTGKVAQPSKTMENKRMDTEERYEDVHERLGRENNLDGNMKTSDACSNPQNRVPIHDPTSNNPTSRPTKESEVLTRVERNVDVLIFHPELSVDLKKAPVEDVIFQRPVLVKTKTAKDRQDAAILQNNGHVFETADDDDWSTLGYDDDGIEFIDGEQDFYKIFGYNEDTAAMLRATRIYSLDSGDNSGQKSSKTGENKMPAVPVPAPPSTNDSYLQRHMRLREMTSTSDAPLASTSIRETLGLDTKLSVSNQNLGEREKAQAKLHPGSKGRFGDLTQGVGFNFNEESSKPSVTVNLDRSSERVPVANFDSQSSQQNPFYGNGKETSNVPFQYRRRIQSESEVEQAMFEQRQAEALSKTLPLPNMGRPGKGGLAGVHSNNHSNNGQRRLSVENLSSHGNGDKMAYLGSSSNMTGGQFSTFSVEPVHKASSDSLIRSASKKLEALYNQETLGGSQDNVRDGRGRQGRGGEFSSNGAPSFPPGAKTPGAHNSRHFQEANTVHSEVSTEPGKQRHPYKRIAPAPPKANPNNHNNNLYRAPAHNYPYNQPQRQQQQHHHHHHQQQQQQQQRASIYMRQQGAGDQGAYKKRVAASLTQQKPRKLKPILHQGDPTRQPPPPRFASEYR